jgi:hypothetical protein
MPLWTSRASAPPNSLLEDACGMHKDQHIFIHVLLNPVILSGCFHIFLLFFLPAQINALKQVVLVVIENHSMVFGTWLPFMTKIHDMAQGI